MLKLSGRLEPLLIQDFRTDLLEITTCGELPKVIRGKYAYIGDPHAAEDGYGALLIPERFGTAPQIASNLFRLPPDFEYLETGDLVRIDPKGGKIKTLFRKSSLHNSILITERCNHYCLMCSQPPKDIDDSALLEETIELIGRMPTSLGRLGITGGEPTLYKGGLTRLLRAAKSQLPWTFIDILTNGRAFLRSEYAAEVASVQHPACMFAIPIYSDDPVVHDYVVQSPGAYDETIEGVLNLKRYRQKVEIRFVIHAQTVQRMVQTCQFIARNLRFVDHVALMGLEITGFTRANLDLLWIDPWEYKDALSEAVHLLNAYRIPASVYNHPLCLVNSDVRSNYRRSISDWKNEYLTQCMECNRRSECGGLFSSAVRYRHSEHIQPFRN